MCVRGGGSVCVLCILLTDLPNCLMMMQSSSHQLLGLMGVSMWACLMGVPIWRHVCESGGTLLPL